jgi:1-acyl-sn-glycerol-3-phosphate acyltransferase
VYFHINNLSYYTKYATQVLSIAVVKLVLVRVTTKNPDTLKTKNGEHYIVVANHRHAFDPFYIACSFRWRDLFHLLPFAAMTANKFLDPWWIRVPAWLAGCFPAHGPKPVHGVAGAVKLLKEGYTVLIFPEGRRVPVGKGPAKPGISRIIDDFPKAQVILTHIEWQKPPRFASVEFAHADVTKNDPDAILDSIYEL